MNRAVVLSIAALSLAALSGAAGRCFWLYIVINCAALLVAVVAATGRRKGGTLENQRLVVAVQ